MVTVEQLIKALQRYPRSSRVLIGMQENHPFEVAIQGITVRERLNREWVDEDADPSDVFLVEGDQLRYGSRALWENLDDEW
jgi:hypothetical protein